jgi:hypothetical protein
VFVVVNSLKQLQILVTKLTSFSDPIMQIILTYICLNRTVGLVYSEIYLIMYLLAVENFGTPVRNPYGCNLVSGDLPASFCFP